MVYKQIFHENSVWLMIVKFDPIFDRNKRNVHTLTHSAAAEKQNYQQISPLESKQYDSGQQTD